MKKKLFFVLLFFSLILFTIGCDLNSVVKTSDETGDAIPMSELEEKIQKVYRLALTTGYEGTYEEWLASIKGEKGEEGVGIVSIDKTSSEGLVDTYTVTYSDGTNSTFTINNGKSAYDLAIDIGYEGTLEEWLVSLIGSKGEQGIQGEQGEDGVSIVSIEKIKTEGLVDTYLLTYSNGNTFEFTINNGEQGIQGEKGETGISAYELYKSLYPNYTKTESEWIDDLVNGRLATVTTPKYTVTFDSNGGSEVNSQEVEELKCITKPTNPVKDGYTFDGWYVNDERWVFSGYLVTEDITLKAKWNVNTYTIYFYPNGGSCSINSLRVEYNTPYTLPTCTKDGYEFIGWFDSNQEEVKDGIYDIASNTNLYASYIINYLIHFDTQGGNEISDIGGKKLIQSLEAPIRNGYKFNGWYYNDTLITAPFEYNFDHSGITLVANWIENVGDFDIKELDDDTIEIVKYNGTDSIVVLPDEIKSKAVILTTGTYLKSDILLGNIRTRKGPHGERPSNHLSEKLESYEFNIIRLND